MQKNNILVHINDIPEKLDLGKEIAIDTETMGLNLIRDRLCLLQIKGSNSKIIHLVQFKDKKYNCPNLKAILGNKEILKIFHFARFDLAAIYMYLGVMCENIFCTKIASKLCRTYTQSHSLKALLKDYLKIEISKEQQTSYWGDKELTEEQKNYAALDVAYLHDIRNKLNIQLMQENRYNLANVCFNFLPTRVILDTLGFNDNADIFNH